MIGIIDYQMGNLSSVKNAFDRLDVEVEIVRDSSKVSNYRSLVLPGVGSFAKGAQSLRELGWDKAIYKAVNTNTPILGICLGMQLLMEKGDEGGEEAGLGLIPGTVKKIKAEDGLKLPHVGWNNFNLKQQHPVFSSLKEGVDVYFVHSYVCDPKDESHIISETNYGNSFASAIGVGCVIGTQYHPEKSMPLGLKLLENFSRWDPAKTVLSSLQGDLC